MGVYWAPVSRCLRRAAPMPLVASLVLWAYFRGTGCVRERNWAIRAVNQTHSFDKDRMCVCVRVCLWEDVHLGSGVLCLFPLHNEEVMSSQTSCWLPLSNSLPSACRWFAIVSAQVLCVCVCLCVFKRQREHLFASVCVFLVHFLCSCPASVTKWRIYW